MATVANSVDIRSLWRTEKFDEELSAELRRAFHDKTRPLAEKFSLFVEFSDLGSWQRFIHDHAGMNCGPTTKLADKHWMATSELSPQKLVSLVNASFITNISLSGTCSCT